MVETDEPTIDKGTGRIPAKGLGSEGEGNATAGRTPSADRESAKETSNVTSRATESSSGTRGEQAHDTTAPLGNDGTMMRGTVVCREESNFQVDMGFGQRH